MIRSGDGMTSAGGSTLSVGRSLRARGERGAGGGGRIYATSWMADGADRPCFGRAGLCTSGGGSPRVGSTAEADRERRGNARRQLVRRLGGLERRRQHRAHRG